MLVSFAIVDAFVLNLYPRMPIPRRRVLYYWGPSSVSCPFATEKLIV